MNPTIDAEFLRIKFPVEPTPWKAKGLRRVSVNSFGFGGTNSHAILDDAFHYLRDHGLVGNHCTTQDPPRDLAGPRSPKSLAGDTIIPEGRGPKLLIWSARDEEGLRRLVTEYQRHFSALELKPSEVSQFIDNLAYTLTSRRTLFKWKSFLVAGTINDLTREDLLSIPQQAISTPSLGFIFTGQGVQWAGMGRELLRFGVFERSLCKAEAYLAKLGVNGDFAKSFLKLRRCLRSTDQNTVNPFARPSKLQLWISWNRLRYVQGRWWAIHPARSPQPIVVERSPRNLHGG